VGFADQESPIVGNVVRLREVRSRSVDCHGVPAEVAASSLFELEHIIQDLASGVADADCR
jgi:hypothetical protein